MGTWTIIGAGRVGGALAERSVAAGQAVTLLRRGDDWTVLGEAPGTPILVCTRNDDLDSVVDRVPPQRRPDLVFVQNGMLRPWLHTRGLEGVTRGLLFFAVQSRGAALEAGPDSPFCGPQAAQVVAILQGLGVPAAVVDAPTFAAWELEKLLWNSVFGLLCQAHGRAVGEVLDAHSDQVAALTAELVAVGQTALGLQVDGAAVLGRLIAYSEAIRGNHAAVKEWRWRNGWFVAEAQRLGLGLPLHAALCHKAGVP